MNIKRLTPFLYYLWVVLLFSCSSTSNLSNQKSIYKMPLYRPENEMPEYRIGIGDELEIKFFRNNRFNEHVFVRPDGRITLQRVGDIYVNGMTPSKLDLYVTQVYSEIIKSPDITIFVRKCSGKMIYIVGEAKMPGAYPLQNGMTLLQALALARWETSDANLKSVVLLRRTNQTSMKAETVNVETMMAQKRLQNDVVLQADDVIYLPKTFIANLENHIKKYYNIILPPWQVFWQIQSIEANIKR